MSVSTEVSDRRSQVAVVELVDPARAPFCVRVCVQPTKTGWDFQLTPTDSQSSEGDRRLKIAASRLCELDALIRRALRRGRVVRRTVPERPRETDEPHQAVEQIAPLLMPTVIEDTLYSYQRAGVAWLLEHDRALLGDDMGLGKTAQALAALRELVRCGEIAWSLVVAPRTLVRNWAAESKRWAPEMTVATALPLGVRREEDWHRIVRRAHVLITSYEQLRDVPKALKANPPDVVIADEAHRLRKVSSLVTQGFRQLRSERLWALTGTPIERDPEDLAVLMSLLDPSRFSSEDKALHPMALRSRVRPYLLRRHKSAVLDELPAVIEDNEILDLMPEQQVAYQVAIADHAQLGNEANFLALFGQLRRICDVDPATGASSKLDRIVDLLSDIAANDEKSVVFSYILEPLRQLRIRLQQEGLDHELLTGEMSLEERSSAVERFNTEPNCTALLASTRVASEGLTLTSANHVMFVNRWWNPSANSQARDRVVRIGQTRVVQVKMFTCRQTVEDRLERLLADKSATFEQIIEALNEPGNDLRRQLQTKP